MEQPKKKLKTGITKDDDNDEVYIPPSFSIQRESRHIEEVKKIAKSGKMFYGVVIDYLEMKNNSFMLVVQIYSPDCDVEVRHVPGQEEGKSLKVLKNYYSTFTPPKKIQSRRDNLIFKHGDVVTLSCFKVSMTGIIQFGTVLSFMDAMFSVCFTIKKEDKEEKEETAESKKQGDPYIQIVATAEFQKILSLNTIRDELCHFNKSKINLFSVFEPKKFEPLPEDARIPGIYEEFHKIRNQSKSWVDTFTPPVAPPVDADQLDSISVVETITKLPVNDFICPYDFTLIPNNILIQNRYNKNGYWVYVINNIGCLEDKEAIFNKPKHLPLLTIDIPCLDIQISNNDELKKSNWSCTKPKMKGVSKPCIKDHQASGMLSGVLNRGSTDPLIKLSIKPLFAADKIFSFTNLPNWKDTAQQLFRAARGIGYITVDAVSLDDDDDVLCKLSSRDASLNFALDPIDTFSYAGLKLDYPSVCAFFQNDKLVYDKIQENVYSTNFVPNKPSNPPFINLNEISTNLSNFQNDYTFYAIPGNNVCKLPGRKGAAPQYNVPDLTNASLVLSTLNFYNINKGDNIAKANEILRGWNEDIPVTIYAVKNN